LAFNRPSLTTIYNRIISDIETRVVGVGTLLRRSVLRILARVYAGAVHTLWGYLDYMSKQLFIATAEGDNLDYRAAEYGILRDSGDYSTGVISTTGINGTIIPVGTQWQNDLGWIYETLDEVTIAGGTASLNIQATVKGTDGNEIAGTILTIVSPIADIATTATVGPDGLQNGTDEETDDSLRNRVLIKKRNAPHGGAQHDYVNWMLEVSGVTRAWVFPLYMGAGTVGCTFVRDNDLNIIPDETQLQEVKDYLTEHTDPITGETIGIPVTALPGLFMLDLTPVTVNFTIKVYPNTTAVQNAIQGELEDLIKLDGGPGETLYRSRIIEAIGLAAGEEHSELVSPAVDITVSQSQIHVLGTITFTDY
jgi:uncharacterized phage protein gp47/JayE